MTIDDDSFYAFIAVGLVVLFAAGIVVAGRRFARKREREGLWDKNGPRNPTPPPGDWGLVPGYGAHRPQIEEDEVDEPRAEHPHDKR